MSPTQEWHHRLQLLQQTLKEQQEFFPAEDSSAEQQTPAAQQRRAVLERELREQTKRLRQTVSDLSEELQSAADEDATPANGLPQFANDLTITDVEEAAGADEGVLLPFPDAVDAEGKAGSVCIEQPAAEQPATPGRNPSLIPIPPPPSRLQRCKNCFGDLAQRAKRWVVSFNAMGGSSHANAANHLGANGDEQVERYRQEALRRVEDVIRKTPWLLPDSRMRRLWDTFVLLTNFTQLLLGPLLIVDSLSLAGDLPLQIFFWFLSMVNIMDAGIRYNTAWVHNDELVTNRNNQRKLYVRTWLVPDAITAVPVDAIVALAGTRGMALRLASLPRLVRIFHAEALFRLSNPGAIDPEYVRFYFNWVPVFKFIFYFAFFIHVLTVTKIALAVDLPTEEEMDALELTGNARREYIQDADNDNRYDYCLFWVWNLLTTSPARLTLLTYNQRVLCFALMCMGVIFQGVIVGRVSLLVLKSGVKQQNETQMRATLQIVSHYNLPRSLKQEVLSMQWHALQSSFNFLSNAGHVLDSLPALMRHEINIYIKIDFVSKSSMFSEAKHQTKIRLATSLQQEYREPGEEVISIGDFGTQMYFILHGFCEVVLPHVGCVAVIKRDDFFGEIALLVDTARTATIRTLTYCDFFVLHREPFARICSSDLEFELSIREKMHSKVPAEHQRENRKRVKVIKLRRARATARAVNALSRPSLRPPASPSVMADIGDDVDSIDLEELEEEIAVVDDHFHSIHSSVGDVEHLVHRMAMEKTKQEREKRDKFVALLDSANRARERQRGRRRSLPVKFVPGSTAPTTELRGTYSEGPTGAASVSPTGAASASPTGAASVSPTGAASASPTGAASVSFLGTSVVSPTAGAAASPRCAGSQQQAPDGAGSPSLTRGASFGFFQSTLPVHNANAQQGVSVRLSAAPGGVEGPIAPRRLSQRRGSVRGDAETPQQHNTGEMLPMATVTRQPSGLRDPKGNVDALSMEGKLNLVIERLNKLEDVRTMVDRTGHMLEEVSQHNEMFADDIFRAVNNVEEQCWACQDLLVHVIKTMDARGGDQSDLPISASAYSLQTFF
eukprot:TRINITY_DN9518_c0_g1_i1.p1 TRINITY_DN9518_c0_g1~~TRINITY_DN9518_c0_g1_i1.p1  ORF type:complete len:1069 (+),score=229.56 TRINITY_DN9518_c0_g1_i1:87-3293(+)